MTQESKTQEIVAAQAGTPAPASELGELPTTALARVVGGGDGGPGSPGDNTGRR